MPPTWAARGMTTSGRGSWRGEGDAGRGGLAQLPVLSLPKGRGHLGLDHDPDQVWEGGPGAPLQLAGRLRGVAAEVVALGRAEVALVEADVVAPVQADEGEGGLDELADAVALAGGDDEVVRFGLLGHGPH